MCPPVTETASGPDSFWAALALAAIVQTAKAAWWAVSNFALGLAVITAWTAPRVWRLTRTAYRAGRRRWLTRTVVLDRQPVAAVTATPEHVLWSELQLKQEASVR